MINRKFPLLFTTLVMVSLLSGCGDGDDEDVKPVEPVDVLYNRAKDALDEGSYKRAIGDFEEVERQHPYSEWAKRAQVMAAYASYKSEKYDDAIAALERFVKLYPNSDQTDYAYYLIALSYYEQISDVGRDQKMTQQALDALNDVIKRFPESSYARDAKIKVDLTKDHLAGKEMKVGMYYLKREEYLAAINRFRFVVENYQTTSHTPEALHRLVECYLALGVQDEAKRNAAVLGYNYPNSAWYRYSYKLLNGTDLEKKEEEGVISRLFNDDDSKPADNKNAAAK